MDITQIVLALVIVAGGLAFFLYGMHIMSSGLEKMAGGKLEQALKKMTSNPFKSLALGAGITVALQSSSALTVMLVGLVNCGVMQIGQTIGVIMGSNIGTTFTAWLLSLMDVGTDNLIVAMLNPKYFSLVLALIGAFMILSGKSVRKKDIGNIMVGFAVLMYGMKMMGDAVSPLADMPEFQNLLVAFNNPLFGVFIGALVTGIIQSSAASVGILQTLASQTGQISYSMAIPIIMGQNIGTCVTALISSIGVSRNAKKVAIVHISFNLIGTAICLSLYLLADSIFKFTFSDLPVDSAGIALVHTVFNVTTTVILLPFMKLLEKIANLFLPNKDEEPEKKSFGGIIDERLLATPSVAVSECEAASVRMALLAKDTLMMSLDLLTNYSDKKKEKILKNEDVLDNYEDQIGTTLVQISSKALSEHNSQICSRVLRVINDFERLGDHAVNLVDVAEEIHEKKIKFTPEAQKEISVLTGAIREILENTFSIYENPDEAAAANIEPLEQVIDNLTRDIKANHVQRLQKGMCTIETGFVLTDLLNNYERVSDHCSNVAVLMIETAHNAFDTHKYLNQVKFGNKNFIDNFEKFSEKYSIS
ncbi:MAG: Na/Pi cotransporter family protein [Oscillospiraceae bacterium]|nr:Na/Pi cotransporter family protein [Oscillospiraceae bacterium]